MLCYMDDIVIDNNRVSPLASCLSFWDAGTPALSRKMLTYTCNRLLQCSSAFARTCTSFGDMIYTCDIYVVLHV